MTIKPIIAAAFIAASALVAASATASAGGGNYYGSHGHYSGHSHVDLGPADASEDFAYYNCRSLKRHAIHTGYSRHWRAYRRCVRNISE
jgi:hypothetical protein